MTLLRRQHGFSLLEVVVAFAIAAMALGITSQIFGQSSRHLRLSQDYTRALALAENLIDQYGAPKSADSEVLVDSQGQFDWRVELGPYELASQTRGTSTQTNANATSLVEIAARVSWERYGKAREVELKSLRLVAEKNARATVDSLR